MTESTLTIAGSDLSGSSGTANRTYTLPSTATNLDNLQIFANGAFLHQGAGKDYSISGLVITFLNTLFDWATITIIYPTSSSGSGSTTYCTILDVQRILSVSTAFSSSTNPTDSQVESYIEAAEDEIDNLTNHAWRQVSVSEEFYDLPVYSYNHGAGLAIHLKHRKVKALDSGQGDSLEVWNGSEYEDWLSTKTEGRNNDYWLDSRKGILYLRHYWAYYKKQSVRLTYRYGESSIPKDIRDATAMIAARMIIMSDDRSALLTDTADVANVSYERRIEELQKKIDRIIHNRTEIYVV